jgi:hypothetical protein
MVHGTWYMVHGTWYMVHGTWYMVHGLGIDDQLTDFKAFSFSFQLAPSGLGEHLSVWGWWLRCVGRMWWQCVSVGERMLLYLVFAAICQSEYVSVWVDEFVCMCRCTVPHWGRISTMAAMIFSHPSTCHPFTSLPPATIAKLPLAPRCVGVYV